MKKPANLFLSCFLLLLAVHAPGAYAAAAGAEVVSVTGKGERRDSAQADWIPAVPKHTVAAGGFVRTGDMSQMALLLADRTQMRLNQNSQMQIKSVADTAEWTQSAVKLNSGRAWSQARPPSALAAGAKVPPAAALKMETPAVTLSIRGTDWEVEVAPDGRTQLVVLSGEVDMANDQGSLKVGAGEAAAAEVGKAPVRLLLANPADRVQWVTAWQLQPRHWLPAPSPALREVVQFIEAADLPAASRRLQALSGSGDPATAREAAVLQADLLALQGETAAALALLAPHADGGKGPAGAVALLARLHLARGEGEAMRTLLLEAVAAHPEAPEIWLARGDLALFEGDVPAAREAFGRALLLAPANADAWFALGRIDTERENIRPARGALTTATAARPNFVQALAEQATLEALAGNLAEAATLFEKTLALAPDSYPALTGRGLLKLKSGDSEGALTDFLRAGVMEPRFARAWLYSGVAFYQQGEVMRAVQAFRHAATLDPRDPLPHVMLGLLAADALDLGEAVDESRAAQERMPFLKSLNQLLNNQKGSANVGSALAAFGMEEWARHYANLSYSPWWAGSHLFLADRYTGNFNKNSELFTGFITDPTVFGASQRQSSLLPAPGHHGRVDLFLDQADWQQAALIGTANGLVLAPFPLAYFISGDLSEASARAAGDDATGSNLTVGLGMRPHHDLGLFLFGTDTRIRANFANDVLPDDPLDIDDRRLDLGINYRVDARNQLWFKAGSGSNEALIRGTVMIPQPLPLERYQISAEQRDVQLRHVFALADDAWLSWGYEDARQEKPAYFDVRVRPQTLLAIAEHTDVESRAAYIDLRGPLLPGWQGELGAFSQHTHALRFGEARVNGTLIDTPVDIDQSFSEINWRGGLQWQLAGQSRLTWVGQTWRRPASVSSLGPVDTLGIAVNDQLTGVGGLYRRGRLQLDLETSPRTYLQVFADHETVRNIASPLTSVVPDLKLDQLDSLRNRRDAFTVQPDLEAAPQFLEGRADTLGLTINHRLTRDHTLAVRYLHADAEQTGLRDGLQIPFMPRHMLRLNSQWALPQRLQVGARATWRSERYEGEANTEAQRIEPGWTFGLSAYWESADKRWVLQGILDNLRADKNASYESRSQLILRASYLF